MVDEITELSGSVAVFWEHKAIVSGIIPRIVLSQALAGLPTRWADDRFDVVLRFDRASYGAPWSFRQLSPQLLACDSGASVELNAP